MPPNPPVMLEEFLCFFLPFPDFWSSAFKPPGNVLRSHMRYRFGHFELVVETRELLANGRAQAIEPQVFDLLSYLITERGRVVTRDEMIDTVWNRRVVSDSAISARINAVRNAIGDSGARQDWIKTIPRRGFRFVGAVEDVEKASLDHTPAPAADEPARRQRIAFCRSPDGTRIAYATSGSGYPLMKVGHWLTHLEHDWHSPIWQPVLDRLNTRFSMVRYDQRGNGLSDWDAPGFSLDTFTDDLEAVVDAAEMKNFALYGTSQGVPIAINYACRHPGKITHLILHGGFAQGRLVRSADSDRAQGEAIITLMRHGWGQPGSAFINAFATMFIPDSTREQLDSLVETQRLTTTPDNAAALRSAVDQFDVSGKLKQISVPTLVIHSRRDAIQPLEQGRLLASEIPDAEFLLLESGNHVILSHEKAWPVFYDGIERFVLRGSDRSA